MPTPAKVQVSGHMPMFVQHAQDSTPTFLGHGEQAPHIDEDPQFNPVMCDLAGSVPLDEIYAGVGAVITYTLTRFSQDAVNILSARARSAANNTITPGYDAPGSRGTLVQGEGAYFKMWLLHANYAKAAFVGMPQGYQFVACRTGRNGIQGGSVNARKLTLTIIALNKFDPTAQTGLGFGSFTLYNNDCSAVTGISLA